MEAIKCAECGADVAVTYQVSDRYFFIENGELDEDLNNFFEPTFAFHCSDDTEHDIEKNISEEKKDQILEYEKKMIGAIVRKFIK